MDGGDISRLFGDLQERLYAIYNAEQHALETLKKAMH